jgi:hypothetical protein
MTRGRAAAAAWLAVLAPLWLAMVACTRWEPIAYDAWNNVVWHRWNRLAWSSVWDLLEYGWRYSNPRLGQTVTTLLYTPGPYHSIVTPLLELALFWLATAIALGRWPSPRRAGDALAFAVVFAIVAACTPQLGPMLFYRPYTGNYLFGLAVNLWWLVPYRFHLAGRAIGRWWWSPALLVLGVVAGTCNEHTGIAFAALGALAIAASVRRGDGVRPWMIAGLVGLVAGFAFLLIAPGNDVRYDGLARQATILERIRDRGALADLVVAGRLWIYMAWALPWLALAVIARRGAPASRTDPPAPAPETHAPAPRADAPGRAQRPWWIALAVAGQVSALTLLASPKLGPRLYLAPVALVSIGLAGWLLARLSSARLRLAGALLSGATLAYVEVVCVATYARVGPAAADRTARILGSPPDAQIAVPPLPASRGKWFIGDDLLEESARRSVAARVGLARIDLDASR